MPKPQRPRPAPLPTKAEILDFVATAEETVGRREIAKAFNVKGADRHALRALLNDMADEGLLEGRRRKPDGRSGGKGRSMPPVTLVEITDRDVDGELLARPQGWDHEEEPPRIVLAPGEGAGGRKGPAIGIGDRVLVRLAPDVDGAYEARVIKRIGQSPSRVLGVFEPLGRGRTPDGIVSPVDKRARNTIAVAGRDAQGAQSGDLVMVEVLPGRTHTGKKGKVVERICHKDDREAITLIAVHAHGIPAIFPDAVLAEADSLPEADAAGRTDLRPLPLVTIDPEDARDHDDAVHAEPDPDPKNPGGHIVTVAIADVAAYVRPGSAIDREASKRGNSTYLPDRVVPMLPERLSADLCSLHEHVDRPCLAVRMVLTKEGKKKSHKFIRGVMCSRASLTYDQVQRAHEGKPDKIAKPLMDEVITPLYAAYQSAAQAREARQPLDLDLAEHKVEVDDQGRITAVTTRERHDAHRLIEEFMILANVCAAETLERRKVGLLYRVHDAPDREKLNALSDFLETIGLKLAKGQVIRPEHFNRIISKSQGSEAEAFISEVVLRSQSQAVYSPDNLGHFGLNLRRYAHFTSPIRRYADLIVHRALVRAHGFGPDPLKDGLSDETIKDLPTIGMEISGFERRSMAAERDAMDRMIAAYMSDRIGAAFTGRISGVTRFGLFVKLDETGADGLVPIRSLGNDYYFHDEDAHALIGERTGEIYRLGDPVEVEVAEAAPITGGLRFELISDPVEREPAGTSGKSGAGKSGSGKSGAGGSGSRHGRGNSRRPRQGRGSYGRDGDRGKGRRR